jgi:integrase
MINSFYPWEEKRKRATRTTAPHLYYNMEVIEMQCRKCRKEAPEGAKFCPWCGAKLVVSKASCRGNGQGSAIKRGNTWTAVWSDGSYLDAAGNYHRRRRWKGGFKTKTAALAYAADPPKTEAAAQVKTPTLRDYYNAWYKSDYLDLSASKQSGYKTAWKRLADLADMEMDKLTIAMIQDCVDDQTDTHYPARNMRSLLSHLYKRAVAEGNARTNLAPFLRLPPLDEKEMETFNEEEIRKLWDAYAAGDRIVGYVLLMIYSGMMPGELMNLKKSMIDYEANEVRGCGRKTKKRKDTPIVFPATIAPVLQDLAEGSTSKTGNVLDIPKYKFYREYHASMAAAGVRDLPPYSCRHTTATALALGEVSPSVIQEIMRHTNFTTTRRYIHIDNTTSHQAINTMVSDQAIVANHAANQPNPEGA